MLVVLVLLLAGVPMLPSGSAHSASLVLHSRAIASLPLNIQVSDTGRNPAGEPTVAVNRYGTVQVVWEEQGQLQDPVGPMGMAFSQDGGTSFGPQTISQVAGSNVEYDVSNAGSSPNGTFWVGYGVCPIPGQPCSLTGTFTSQDYVTAAWNNGTHVSQPILSIPSTLTGSSFVDRDWLASTPNGTVYQTVDDGSGASNNVYLATSYDGIHFGAPQVIYNLNGITMDAFAYNNTLWGVADSNITGDCVILVSSNGGTTWAPTPTSDPGCDTAQSGNIEWQVTWGASHSIDLAYVNSTGVDFVRSTDMGTTWSSPVNVSGIVPAGTIFETPTIAANPVTGAVSIIWLDTRMNTTSYTWYVYESDSYDNGLHWSAPRQLSDTLAGTGRNFWPGDFIGSTITPWGTAAGTWGEDNSSGLLQTYFGQLPLVTPSAGNLTIVVQNSSGSRVANATVSVSGTGSSRSNATGETTFFGLASGVYGVTAYSPAEGSGSATATVVSGSSTRVTVTLSGGPPPLLISHFSATPSSIVLGNSTNFSVSVTGGLAPLGYAYTGLPTGCHSQDLSSFSCTPTVQGSFSVEVFVNDSAGRSVHASTVLVVNPHVANPVIIRSFIALPSTLTLGRTTNFSVNVTGGVLPYSYAYSGLPSPCATVNAAILSCRPSAIGVSNVTVRVSDSAGTSATTWTDLTVIACTSCGTSSPTISSFTAVPNNITLGTGTNLTVKVTGGTLPLRYDFTKLPAGCTNANLSVLACRPSAIGTFNITVTVIDAHGKSAEANVTLRVLTASSGPSSNPSSDLWLWVVVGAAAVLIVVGVLLARRRSSKSPPTPPSGPGPQWTDGGSPGSGAPPPSG